MFKAGSHHSALPHLSLFCTDVGKRFMCLQLCCATSRNCTRLRAPKSLQIRPPLSMRWLLGALLSGWSVWARYGCYSRQAKARPMMGDSVFYRFPSPCDRKHLGNRLWIFSLLTHLSLLVRELAQQFIIWKEKVLASVLHAINSHIADADMADVDMVDAFHRLTDSA